MFSVLSSAGTAVAALRVNYDTYFALSFTEKSKYLTGLAPKWNLTIVILMQIWVWSEFVTMMFNKRRRAVHDFIAGTVVVRSDVVA